MLEMRQKFLSDENVLESPAALIFSSNFLISFKRNYQLLIQQRAVNAVPLSPFLPINIHTHLRRILSLTLPTTTTKLQLFHQQLFCSGARVMQQHIASAECVSAVVCLLINKLP
jgi:hypothetical protein